DGATSSEQNPVHLYTSPGSYTVTLTAAGPCGSDTKSEVVPVLVFNRTFGGAGSDEALSVKATSDGGYIVAGYKTNCAGNTDALLIKTDASGDASAGHGWQKTLGGAGNDVLCSVLQTRDGGYVAAGYTYVANELTRCGGNYHGWLVKTDPNGVVTWALTLDGSGQDSISSVFQTSDGGYILAGTTQPEGGSPHAWLVKADPGGSKVWEKNFTNLGNDEALCVLQTPDSGYIVACNTTDGTSHDVWLIKTDIDGAITWDKTMSGAGLSFASSLQQTLDGGYIVAGSFFSCATCSSDALLIKTDANGDTQDGKGWIRTYDAGGSDHTNSVGKTLDGGYILAGSTFRDTVDACLIKVDADGTMIWDKLMGGDGDDVFCAVEQTPDGGYILAGYTSSYGAGKKDVWLIKTDANGTAPSTQQ
ncbi:MAG TPA: PKD domain-containing protein, partial [Desulfomonilia bacterium]|nr:PKD domain-containing protein [Desulfomonilia bacterium]